MHKLPSTLLRQRLPAVTNKLRCKPSQPAHSLSHVIDEIKRATEALNNLTKTAKHAQKTHRSTLRPTTDNADTDTDAFGTPSESSDAPPGTIQITRKGLYKVKHEHLTAEERLQYKEQPMTPLAAELRQLIQLRGPITVHEYMTKCLSHTQYGYYSSKENVIGVTGDFITNPEISQIYGELVAVDCIDKLYKLQQKLQCEFDCIQLIELGPGNATLLTDMLRTYKQFNKLYKKLQIHLVETSGVMRRKQCTALNIQFNTIKYVDHRSNIYDPTVRTTNKTLNLYDKQGKLITDKAVEVQPEQAPESGTTADGISVHWYNDIRDIPAANSGDKKMFQTLVAHEFLDALPIHQFQYTERGWLEVMVDIDESKDTPHYFRFVLSNSATPAVNMFLPANKGHTNNVQIGDRLEISPQQLAVAEDIAVRIGSGHGYAVMIDYGDFKSFENTLQGVKQHKYVNVLSEPGNVDLTALVNFKYITQIAEQTIQRFELNATVLPMITQHEYLRNLGIAARLEVMYNAMTAEQQQKQGLGMIAAAERLVAMDQMGGLFKVLRLGTSDMLVQDVQYYTRNDEDKHSDREPVKAQQTSHVNSVT